jgi:hypothetical protein
MHPIRDIDPHAIARLRQLYLEISSDAIEHLKLKAIRRNLVLSHILKGPADDLLVMRGNRGIDALLSRTRAEELLQ